MACEHLQVGECFFKTQKSRISKPSSLTSHAALIYRHRVSLFQYHVKDSTDRVAEPVCDAHTVLHDCRNGLLGRLVRKPFFKLQALCEHLADIWTRCYRCAPCKAIAPLYEQLASQLSRPNKITFTKVDTDRQKDIVQSYGISAYVRLVCLAASCI